MGIKTDGRVNISLKSVPLGFDPSDSNLNFQWLSDPGKTEKSLIAIVSGEYKLAEIKMGNPWSILCARSADEKITGCSRSEPNCGVYVLNQSTQERKNNKLSSGGLFHLEPRSAVPGYARVG